MFTFADYKKALKGAGPKLKENILWRAREDPNIGLPEYVMLEDMAYPGIYGPIKTRRKEGENQNEKKERPRSHGAGAH